MHRASTLGILLTALLFVPLGRAEVPADAVWIDVRSPVEYVREHLPQAKLMPVDTIAEGIDTLGLTKDTPIYLYCAVGHRAEQARQTLLSLGYTNVTNAGGLEDARRLAGQQRAPAGAR